MLANSTQDKLSHDYSIFILVSLLGIVILLIGSGLYEADPMPKDEILVSCLSIILLISVYANSKKLTFIDPKVLFGFILFNSFFILRLLLPATQDVETKAFFTHIISLGVFVSVYSASSEALSSSRSNFLAKFNPKLALASFSIATLIILLSTQLAQFHSEINMLHFRPGGYLNPNTTAAIALMLTFSVHKLTPTGAYQPIAIILTISIILLSQSRSALLAFIPFLAYIFIKDSTKKIMIASMIMTALLLIALVSSPELREFPSAFFQRFVSDVSSGIRLSLLKSGWLSFTEAPIWGNGYRYIASISGHATHNEIIETLSNFGLIGLIIISIAFYYLYFSFSILFFVACIAPTILFTHNFFDAYAFQAILGFALASERSRQLTQNSKE